MLKGYDELYIYIFVYMIGEGGVYQRKRDGSQGERNPRGKREMVEHSI